MIFFPFALVVGALLHQVSANPNPVEPTSDNNNTFPIIFDGNVTRAAGGNGSDYYILTKNSSQYIWINNQADDNEYDYLIISDDLCNSLKVWRNLSSLSLPNAGENDIAILCEPANSQSHPITVIVEDYQISECHQHLAILWKDVQYVILPEKWATNYEGELMDTLILSEFIPLPSILDNTIINIFSDEPVTTILTPTNMDKFQARFDWNKRDILLTPNDDHNIYIRLVNFFDIHRGKLELSREWSNKLTVYTKDFGLNTFVVLSNAYVMSLILEQHEKLKKSQYKLSKQTRENLRINRNNEGLADNDKLPGVLVVSKIAPENMHAKWNDTTAELLLCTNENVCVIVENWCTSEKSRLNAIKFDVDPSTNEVFFDGIEKLECQQPTAQSNQDRLVESLNGLFADAQKVYELSRNNRNDKAILRRCISLAYANNKTGKPDEVYQLFDLSSSSEAFYFLRNTCVNAARLVKEAFKDVTLDDVRETIERSAKIYDIKHPVGRNDSWPKLQDNLQKLRESFANLDKWNDFKSELSNALYPN